MNAERLESRRLLAFTPFTDEVLVPGSSPDSYDLAVAGDGSFMVAYADGTAVRVVRYTEGGEQVGVITAASFATAVVNDVSVAMDADGDAVLAYTSFEPSANFGEFRYSHINRSGVVDDGGVLDIFDRGRAADVAVSMDPGGGFFIGSIGYVARAAYQLRFRAFDASGVLRGPAFTAFQQTLLESAVDDLDVAAKHDGSGAVFAYAFVDEGGVVQRVNYGRVSTSALVGSIGKIEGVEVRTPSVAIHPDGSFAIAYQQLMVETFGFPVQTWTDSRIRRFDASGVQSGNTISLLGPESGNRVNAITPQIDATPDGGFVVTYAQRFHGQPGAPHFEATTLHARRFDAAGQRVGFVTLYNQLLNLGREYDVLPVVGVGPDGKSVVAYSEFIGGETVRFRKELPDFELVGSELFVNGTDFADRITVNRRGSDLVVERDDGTVAVAGTFDAAGVRFLSITGYDGDDNIVNATDLPSTIHGGNGHDTIWGGTGSDRIRGFGGNDSLRGGDGNDDVLGDNGDDTLHGGDGTDTLTGGPGEDALLFGEVVDRTVRGVSFDRGVLRFAGGAGNDIVLIRESGRGAVVHVDGLTTAFPLDDIRRVEMVGNLGDDALELSVLFPRPAMLDGGPGVDRLSGGAGEDTLLGGDGNDGLFGRRGGDLIRAGPGNDHVDGFSGDDTIDGGPGADHLNAGNENDTIDYSSRTNPLRIVHREFTSDGEGEVGEGDQLFSFERVLGGAGDDFIAIGHTIHGGGGNDTLVGSTRDDQLFGDGGNDDLNGGRGKDHLEGGAGDDTLRSSDVGVVDSLFAGAGNDRFFTDDSSRDILHGGPGDDEADADERDDVLTVESVS